MFSNHDIAKILYEIAAYLEMDGVPFKPRAYEKAAQSVEAFPHDEDLTQMYKAGGAKALKNIPGIGASIAEKVGELLTKGRLAFYDRLKKKMPVDVWGLMAVEGIGPKHVKVLWQKLHIKNVRDLESALRAGNVRTLPGFGARSEEKLLKSVEFLKQYAGRFSIFEALPVARRIEAYLSGVKEVRKVVVAGSLRRWKETIGDIDILVVSAHPEPVMRAFVNMKDVSDVVAHGATKSAVRLSSGLDVDIRVVGPESFGAALNYFTGSKPHNVALREIAIKKGYKLNEYGLSRKGKVPAKVGSASGGKSKKRRTENWQMVAGATEEEIYKKLGLSYIPPELREDAGEIDAARTGDLPELVEEKDIRGDLQTQTNWTDGENSIEEMAEAAKKRGLEYLAITDHTKGLQITGGSDEKRLLKQMAEIDKLNAKIKNQKPKFRILKSAEVDILKDGSLDIEDAVLAKLDVVGISVHSYFALSREEQTRRIITAMQNPHADILFHPTGRIVGSREPYDVNMDEVVKAAQRTGTVLEINASERLDLKDEYARKAVEAGIKVAINTDAHSVSHFAWLEYGVAQARRGWVKKSDVINALPLKALLVFLKKKKTSRF